MKVRQRNVYLLIIISFLQSLVFYAGISTIYRQHFGLKLSDIFIIESISWIVTFSMELPFGKFSDRYGYKKIIILGNLMFFISKIVFYHANTFNIFLLERIILSIAIAALSGSVSGLFYESTKNGTKFYGYLTSIGTIGMIISSFLTPLILEKGYKLTSYLTIYPYGLSFILSFFLIDYRILNKKGKLTTLSCLKSLLKTPNIIVFIIMAALITEISYAIGVVLNQSQYEKCGLPYKYFSIIFGFMQVIPIVSSLSFKLIKAVGKRNIILTVIFIIVSGCFVLSNTSNIIVSIIFIAAISFASSIFIPLSFDIQQTSIQSKNRALYLSLFAMIMELVSVILNVMIGKMADISLSLTFITMGIGLIIISAVYLLLNKEINLKAVVKKVS